MPAGRVACRWPWMRCRLRGGFAAVWPIAASGGAANDAIAAKKINHIKNAKMLSFENEKVGKVPLERKNSAQRPGLPEKAHEHSSPCDRKALIRQCLEQAVVKTECESGQPHKRRNACVQKGNKRLQGTAESFNCLVKRMCTSER